MQPASPNKVGACSTHPLPSGTSCASGKRPCFRITAQRRKTAANAASPAITEPRIAGAAKYEPYGAYSNQHQL
ncbi:hypothetical protein DXT96_11335 [Agrobacterium sp. ICMP 6402]|nr:hypothetical protein [Agrobacterium sp. ICMP 6402]